MAEGGLRLGEGDDVADGVGVRHEHDQAVEPQGDAAVRRAAVSQCIQQVAELDFGFLADIQGFEHVALRCDVVDPDRSAAKLDSIQHHIIRLRQRPGRIGGQLVDGPRHGERMVRRRQRAVLPLVEHGPVGDPQRRPAVLDEPEVRAEPQAQGTERVVDHPVAVRPKEDEVAVPCAGPLEDVLRDLGAEELEDRRLQPVEPRGAFVDLDVGKATGAVSADEVLIVVDGLAREDARPTRGPQRGDAAARIVGGPAEHVEVHCAHQVADVDQFQRVAQVRLVAAEPPHGLRPGEGGELRERHPEDALEERAQHALGELHDVRLGDERSLDVDLRELGLPVRAQVFVAIAAGDLVVAVEARHHQQLLEDLWRLGQSEERPGVRAARHQVVACTLRSGAREGGRLDLEVARLLEVAPDVAGHPCPQAQAFLHLGPAQVHVAVPQADVLARPGVFVKLERRRLGGVQYLEGGPEHLDLPRREVRIDHAFRTRPDAPGGPQHVLVADAVRGLEALGFVGIVDDLHDAGPVPQVEEDHAAVVAPAVYPAGQFHAFADVGRGEGGAVMGAHGHV